MALLARTRSQPPQRRRKIVPGVFLGSLVAAWACCSWLMAEPPKWPGGRFPQFAAPDPQAMFERLFAPPGDEEKKALAGIDVSIQEERQMGEAALRGFLAELKARKIQVVRRGKDVDYLRELAGAIEPLMSNRRRYGSIQVYLAQSPQCDARSFPGGSVVFFRGLLDSAGSEAALVGIVGHELAHLDRGHLLSRARRVKLARQTFAGGVGGTSPEEFFARGTTALKVWTRPFQPEDEEEADRDGARWAYQAGYDPREMARLFLDLQERQGAGPMALPSFLRSHAAPGDRHKAVMKLYEELQRETPKERLYVGKENLRRRVARSRQEFAQ